MTDKTLEDAFNSLMDAADKIKQIWPTWVEA